MHLRGQVEDYPEYHAPLTEMANPSRTVLLCQFHWGGGFRKSIESAQRQALPWQRGGERNGNACLTAWDIALAGMGVSPVGHSDPVIPNEGVIAHQIKGTTGITGS